MEARTVLVIGSTGILAPASEILERRGHRVIGMSRRGRSGAIGVDARDAAALAAALDGASWDDAVAYRPAVSDASLGYLREATPGRCVVVRTSSEAEGAAVLPPESVLLGWTKGPLPRWHTAEEVSAVALEVLGDGVPRSLGVVRPWSARP